MGMNRCCFVNGVVLVIEEVSFTSVLTIEDETEPEFGDCCERPSSDSLSPLPVIFGDWIFDTDMSSAIELFELEPGVSNLRYCANTLLHVLHTYSPFSIKVTPSPSCSFG